MSVKAKRSEAEILNDLRGVESSLSPENLSWDGERPAREVAAARKRLLAERKALVKELGREPSDRELYAF